MGINEQYVEQEEIRVLLVLPWSEQVLVQGSGRVGRLPRLKIPKWTRTVQRLSDELRVRWGLGSIVIEFLPQREEQPRCAVMEVRSHKCMFSHFGLAAVHLDDLCEAELTQSDRIALKMIIDGDTRGRGPFSKLRWIDEAQDWIRQDASRRNLNFNEDVRQLSAGGNFALVRFGTVEGPAYWLKATGMLNAHELNITATLARYFPDSVPPFVTARADWNAWVSEEAGRPLDEVSDFSALEQSANCLGKLQTASISRISGLLANGCFDQRLSIVRGHLPDLICYLEQIMGRQTSTRALPLSSTQLNRLETALRNACDEMEALQIPDSLVHNDMNSGNILFDGTRALFIDWAEGFVGNPFFTFQHLLAYALSLDQTQSLGASLTKLYTMHWREHLGDRAITRALALAAPLAIASYVIGRDTCTLANNRRDTHAESYTRSLARHMYRATQAPEFLEALCH